MPRPKRVPDPGLPHRLERVRKETHLSLNEFWKELGGEEVCSYQSAQNYHYDRDPPVAYLVAVSKSFGATVEWLATETGPMHWPKIEKIPIDLQWRECSGEALGVFRDNKASETMDADTFFDQVTLLTRAAEELLEELTRERGYRASYALETNQEGEGGEVGTHVKGDVDAIQIDWWLEETEEEQEWREQQENAARTEPSVAWQLLVPLLANGYGTVWNGVVEFCEITGLGTDHLTLASRDSALRRITGLIQDLLPDPGIPRSAMRSPDTVLKVVDSVQGQFVIDSPE